MTDSTSLVAVVGGLLVVVVALGLIGAGAAGPGGEATASVGAQEDDSEAAVSEDAYVKPAPTDPEDEYYEAEDPDGNWISYVNPRDRYRSPYLGDGSGKICVTLLNEAGEHVVGESVPNTSVTIPTSEELEWHEDADPMVVDFPMTKHYDRPLDADQFGTNPDLPQGDGYLDSHCIEMHGQPEDATIEYGEAQIEGEHADDIEVVGYIQTENEAWDSDVDPIDAAGSYDEVGGGWTKYEGGSHGQAVVVLQLDGVDEEGNDTDSEGNETDGSTDNVSDEGSDDAADDELPGFGAIAVLAALATTTVLAIRHRTR